MLALRECIRDDRNLGGREDMEGRAGFSVMTARFG